MEVSPDLRELLALFHSRDVDCIVVGAHALALHGLPRFTADLDLLLRRNEKNADRVMAALSDFGFSGLGLSRDDFLKPDQVIQLGNPPNRVDLLTDISGVEWDDAESGAVEGALGGLSFRFLGRDELIRNKRASGRLKDQADIESLLSDDQ